MSEMKADDVRAVVRDHYGSIARGTTTGCAPGCCSTAGTAAATLGYSSDQTGAVPDGADLGLGCGNPTAIASLREGETVLDLGAGGGFDCFIAARQVGPRGQVIGVDMTADMVARARTHARKVNAANEPTADDRETARALACCVSIFVARLPSPYREAVTLVELEGVTVREAAEMVGVSISGMKSRVQRGRAQLRELFDECCEIALDARGKVIDYTPRPRSCRPCT
jgi:SAM-dependent methyltransferase